MRDALIDPAVVNSPPSTHAGGSGPAPSGSHSSSACTWPLTPEPVFSGSQGFVHWAAATSAKEVASVYASRASVDRIMVGEPGCRWRRAWSVRAHVLGNSHAVAGIRA